MNICPLWEKCKVDCPHKTEHNTRHSMGFNLCRYPCQQYGRPKGTNAKCRLIRKDKNV